MKKLIFSILFSVILIFAIKSTCNAANASISCNSNATVGEKITITVTGSAVQWNLELKVNGETIAKNSEVDNVNGNKTINFSGTYTPSTSGKLNVTLTGTATEASDGSTIRNFESKTINVQEKEVTPPQKSTEARLKNLGITPNDFTGFRRDTTTYNVQVPNNVSKVKVYATALDSKAKVSGTGNVALKEGENTVNVTVTAEAGNTKIYTLNITRVSSTDNTDNTNNSENGESEARLKNLGIKPEEYDFTGFKKDTTSYSVEVPNEVAEIEVYAEAVSEKAKVEGTGKLTLNEGLNKIEIKVTAEDGTEKIYTIEVTRIASGTTDDEEENKELGLSSLLIKNFSLSPKFDTKTYEYTLGLREDLSSLEIEAKANNSNATIEILGNENLQEGENVITILVSNAETEEYATYQIIVNKNTENNEIVGTVNWLKPSTWGLKEKIIIGVAILLLIIIIVAIIIKIKLSRRKDEDLDLPGAEELDKALAEHQELSDETEEINTNVNNYNQYEEYSNEEQEKPKSDIEKAQEYFESYTKRRGKHF